MAAGSRSSDGRMIFRRRSASISGDCREDRKIRKSEVTDAEGVIAWAKFAEVDDKR